MESEIFISGMSTWKFE